MEDLILLLILSLACWWVPYSLYKFFFDKKFRKDFSKDQKNKKTKEKTSYQKNDDSSNTDSKKNMNDALNGDKEFGQILGLKGKVNIEDIQKAYHNKIKEYHPDKVSMMAGELRELAEKRTKEINEAYEYFKKKYG